MRGGTKWCRAPRKTRRMMAVNSVAPTPGYNVAKCWFACRGSQARGSFGRTVTAISRMCVARRCSMSTGHRSSSPPGCCGASSHGHLPNWGGFKYSVARQHTRRRQVHVRSGYTRAYTYKSRCCCVMERNSGRGRGVGLSRLLAPIVSPRYHAATDRASWLYPLVLCASV